MREQVSKTKELFKLPISLADRLDISVVHCSSPRA
jgi:hypothetical protein